MKLFPETRYGTRRRGSHALRRNKDELNEPNWKKWSSTEWCKDPKAARVSKMKLVPESRWRKGKGPPTVKEKGWIITHCRKESSKKGYKDSKQLNSIRWNSPQRQEGGKGEAVVAGKRDTYSQPRKWGRRRRRRTLKTANKTRRKNRPGSQMEPKDGQPVMRRGSSYVRTMAMDKQADLES